MSCPFSNKKSACDDGPDGMLYGEYLMLDKILNAQRMLSARKDQDNKEIVAHDEHLFIVIHQTYELWFKQIIYELDLVRGEFINYVNVQNVQTQLNVSEIRKRLNRIVTILKLLVDQVLILETMAPMDFNAFRTYLSTASGFQSLQFRMIENKLGLRHENRGIRFNQSYKKVFDNNDDALEDIQKSLNEPSLLNLLEKWLESIEELPQMQHLWCHYKTTIQMLLMNDENSDKQHCDVRNDNAIKKKREAYDTIFDTQMHEALMKRGERKLSCRAMHAGILISLYKDEAYFATSHQLLMLLVDIDSMLSKWRFNHMMMVQRMIGSACGTGGSSGYQYLRSTLSDRYKPFIDISNMASFLIPKELLLPLTSLSTTQLQ